MATGPGTMQTHRMLRLYRDTAALAFLRAVKAWPVAFSLVVYAVIMIAAIVLTRPLGIIGGFAQGLVAAACASGYLQLLSQAVQGHPVKLEDLTKGFRARFWDVISVMFALWIIGFVVSMLVNGAGPTNGPAIAAMVGLAMAFFLNPVPELLYLGQSRSFDLLLQSARFVLANPVAWFLPNLILVPLVLGPAGWLSVSQPGELLLVFSRVFSLEGVVGLFASLPLWSAPLLLLFVHYLMVFRGLLFQGLSSGSVRQREWQARTRT